MLTSAVQLSFLLLLFSLSQSRFGHVARAQSNRPSQAPPSTFPSATTTATQSDSSVSTTGSASSLSPTTSATLSSTAFPPLDTVSPCVSDCLQQATGAANCSSLTDVNCFCNRRNYTTVIVSCITSSCPDQINVTEALARRFCALAEGSPSLTFPTPSVTSIASSSSLPTTASGTNTSPAGTSSSSGAPSPTTSTNFARSIKVGIVRNGSGVLALLTVFAMLFGGLAVI